MITGLFLVLPLTLPLTLPTSSLIPLHLYNAYTHTHIYTHPPTHTHILTNRSSAYQIMSLTWNGSQWWGGGLSKSHSKRSAQITQQLNTPLNPLILPFNTNLLPHHIHHRFDTDKTQHKGTIYFTIWKRMRKGSSHLCDLTRIHALA